jgi:lysophospholipase L1-like esterase
VTAVADALRGVAEEDHIPFVDPLRERWITGNRRKGTGNAPRYILPDATHPTPEGAHYIAGLLVADLRRLKLAQP